MSRKRIKVSVTLASYNSKDFISEAIESVLKQNFDDFELVILDDGSNDDTFDVIKQYSNNQRVRIYRQKNKGIGFSRQRLELLAKGEYVSPLDGDDIMLTGKLKMQSDVLDRNKTVGLVYGKPIFIDKIGRIIKHRKMTKTVGPKFGGNINKTWDLLFGTIPFGSCMYRKDLLQKVGGYNKKLKIAADLDIFLKLAESSEVRFINKFVYKYRWHKNNVSNNRPAMRKEIKLVKRRAILRRYPASKSLDLNWLD